MTSAALRWYVGLDSASVRTFNDLGEAFVKQYKYNVDMAPDRDQLSAPSDFTEMVNMGIRLKEGVREGCLSKEEVSSSKKYGSSFTRKKEGETNAVSMGRKKVSFDPIIVSYAELYPSLGLKNLLQPRNPPQIPEPLPWWYKPQLRCAFHQGAPDHDIENCYPLKYEVQKLVKSGMVSIEDRAPNVKANPSPAHGNSSVNMVDGCLGSFRVFDVRRIRRSLVEMHKTLCTISDCEHDHAGCAIYSSRDIDNGNVIFLVFKTPERVVIQFNSSSNNNANRSVLLLVIRLAGPVLYASDRVVTYQYNATMLEDGQEVPLPTTNSVVNIVDIAKVTRSSRVFGLVFPKEGIEDVSIGKKVDVPVANTISAPKCQSGESSNLKPSDDDKRSTTKSVGASLCRA
ncbi:hypothetical protein KIW84_050517 [Lathyrus oleraceus]|uniref:Uncharacterized protein n=1 Tax=Pisum sativum TaxID=3888 RepID=A0A9D4WK31_PEA|nr:hypothetical protein KIW84_050517 [Pisum sativum]